MYKIGPTQQKVLITLLGGVALGFAPDSRQYFKILRSIHQEWKKIDQRNFNRSVHRLSMERLVEPKELSDGSYRLVLTKEGKRLALRQMILGGSIRFKKPSKWDGKWRVVIFDIPEKQRGFRTVLRSHLYELRFYKLQQSVFVSPWPYEKPTLELVDLYDATPYVRVITAEKIDNEAKLRRHFFKK